MSSIQASTDITQVKPEEVQKYVDLFFQEVIRVVNGDLDFQTNFNAKLISVTFSAANTNVAVSHGLGRAPNGYIVTSASASTSVYNGTGGSTAAVINLMANAPATVGLLIF